MNKKKLIISSTAITGLLLSVLILGMVVADTSDSATGSFGLNAPPIVSGVQYVDATYGLTSTLTPDDSTIFGVNVTIQHSSEIAWIRNVTFYLFDDSVHGSDWQSADPDGIQLTTITWNESNDLWSIDQGAMSEWTIQSPVDPGSAYASDTTVLVARFDISRAARFDTDWNCTVLAFDDDVSPESDSASEAGLVTMNAHYEMSFSSATFSWGADVQPSSTNNTHDGLSLQIYANAAWEIRLNATDFLPDGDDIEAQNILIWDADGSNGGASLYIRNTIQTCTSTWDAQAAMTDEIGFTRTAYFFLNPGTYFSTGVTHNTTVTAWIQGDT